MAIRVDLFHLRGGQKASHVCEIEIEMEGEAEVFFVPIRPGQYAWGCKGLEEKGLAGKFIVK